MRKALVVLMVTGILGGPFANLAQAASFCKLQEKLGVVNVRECEDGW